MIQGYKCECGEGKDVYYCNLALWPSDEVFCSCGKIMEKVFPLVADTHTEWRVQCES